MEDNALITKEGLEHIKDELNFLKTVKRKEISERIREAKELGDLSENAEYTEAKEEQAFVEGKVMELEYVLKNSQVIDSKNISDTVKVGSMIKVKNNEKETEYKIVGSNESDPISGKISYESPLGKALMNKKAGESFSVKVPQGVIEYTIVSIK